MRNLTIDGERMLNRLLSVALFIVLAFGLTTLAAAQKSEGEHKGERGERPDPQARMERLSQHLELTDEQVAQLRPIFEEQETRMRAFREQRQSGEGGSGEEHRAARQEMMGKLHTDLAAVLTEDQLAKFDAMNERRRQNRGERGDHRDGGGRDHRGGHDDGAEESSEDHTQ